MIKVLFPGGHQDGHPLLRPRKKYELRKLVVTAGGSETCFERLVEQIRLASPVEIRADAAAAAGHVGLR